MKQGTGTAVLEMKDISKRFPGVIALKDARLCLHKGEVHALVGENGAGKSTLMKILLGIHQADTGTIQYKGAAFRADSPNVALHAGISMIHQEISLVPSMTVAENIWLGREQLFSSFGIINSAKRTKKTTELLAEYNIPIKASSIVGNLSIANMQLVEIARAISYDADIVIMDEPTSALTQAEIALLYSIIRKLADRGVAIVFISHKLDEIFAICDRVTVMRDGQFIMTEDIGNLDTNQLITQIAGRELDEMFPKLEAQITSPVLEVRNFNSVGVFQDISFTVCKGEILGFSGLMGAGRTEIVRALFGVDPYDSGEVLLEGKPISIHSPSQAIGHGICMVTEDRLRMGAMHMHAIRYNITIADLKRFCRLDFIDKKAEAEASKETVEKLNIKLSSDMQPISSLSGGNQQKVIIGRCLLPDPKVLILDEPTRGIDVGSKAEIHRLISTLAQQGMAIILISSELPEVMGMSDRILVISSGRITAEYQREEFDQERIMKSAFGLS